MFRPGERIECIKAAEGTILNAGYYTVERATDEFVYLEEIVGGWHISRFVSAHTSFSLTEIS